MEPRFWWSLLLKDWIFFSSTTHFLHAFVFLFQRFNLDVFHFHVDIVDEKKIQSWWSLLNSFLFQYINSLVSSLLNSLL
jgi:hypothetical protein